MSLIDDHFFNPRGVGTLIPSPKVGSGEAGSLASGDWVRFQIECTENAQIKQIVFRAFGGPVTLAAASWVVENCQHQSMAEALRLDENTLIQALAIPAIKAHCAAVVIAAFQRAMMLCESRGSCRTSLTY